MVMMICGTIQTSNSSSSDFRWARTKAKTFLECPGQNLFRTVEKSRKSQNVWSQQKNATFWPFSPSWGNWPICRQDFTLAQKTQWALTCCMPHFLSFHNLTELDIKVWQTNKQTFEGKMQEDTRARMRTRLTPIAEYQMEETSYKSDKKVLIIPKFLKGIIAPDILLLIGCSIIW